MNHRLANILALLLIASGVLFVAYAAISLHSSPVDLAAPRVQNHVEGPVSKLNSEIAKNINPSPLGEGGPGAPGPDEGFRPVTATAVTTSGTDIVATTPSSEALIAAPARHPPDSTDSTDRTAARRQAAILWVGLALPLLFITFVLIVVLRRLRPPPMKHTGPSDTTDLWQEAGKRMK
jgi:hypothetical protein